MSLNSILNAVNPAIRLAPPFLSDTPFNPSPPIVLFLNPILLASAVPLLFAGPPPPPPPTPRPLYPLFEAELLFVEAAAHLAFFLIAEVTATISPLMRFMGDTSHVHDDDDGDVETNENEVDRRRGLGKGVRRDIAMY